VLNSIAKGSTKWQMDSESRLFSLRISDSFCISWSRRCIEWLYNEGWKPGLLLDRPKRKQCDPSTYCSFNLFCCLLLLRSTVTGKIRRCSCVKEFNVSDASYNIHLCYDTAELAILQEKKSYLIECGKPCFVRG